MWQVEEQCGRDALETPGDEWADLESRCCVASPFQSREWLVPWWTFFAHGELRVVSVRRNGRLCALLPLVIESNGDTNRVTLLGTGNSDHLDMLADDRYREVAAAMAVDAVTQCLTPRDWCDFEQLPECSALLTIPAPFGWQWETEQCDVCPTLVIAGAGCNPVPSRRTGDAQYARRRLARLGAVAIALVGHDTLDEALAALFALHQARWEERSDAGVLGTAAVRCFLRRVAAAFLERGLLRLYTLRIDRQIVAVHLGFQWRARRYYYIGGFDPALASLSVGTVLLEHAIRDASNEGAAEFDFLRGAEAYKYRWGAIDRPSYRRILRRPASS